MAPLKLMGIIESVSSNSETADIIAYALSLANAIRMGTHDGFFDARHALYDKALCFCVASFESMVDLGLEGEDLYDEFNDLVERFQSWADARRISLT